MFGKRWRLFRLHGIPISVDASWLIILALVTFSIAANIPALLQRFYGDAAPFVSPWEYWVVGFITALTFFGCILLHELGHAVVARARGMRIHGITLFLFGGVAEIGDEPTTAKTEFLMAIAGPVVSLILGIGFGLLARVGYVAGWHPLVVLACSYLGIINLVIFAFNLIPAFPLDGGRVFRSILWGATGNLRRATYIASLVGQVFAWLLIGWGLVQIFTENWLNGIWSALIGMFLNTAAQSGYRQLLLRQVLHGEPVRRFMNPEPIIVPPWLDLEHWLEDYVYRYHRKLFPVASNGHLEGIITTQSLSRIPRAEWRLHTVGEVMQRDIRPLTIAPDADALDALAKMQRTGISRLLVTEGDHVVGIVSLKDLLRFLNLKLELGETPTDVSRPSGPEAELGQPRVPVHH
jgi:Zn-dependent protease